MTVLPFFGPFPRRYPLVTSSVQLSSAEQSRSARIGAVLFRNRGWLPVPFLLVPLLTPGDMSPRSWAAAALLIVLGELVRIGVERGRQSRPDIKLGICGEHGGDPASVAFCDEVGLDYVSCSPFRVPIARLAAAQAALGRKAASQA